MATVVNKYAGAEIASVRLTGGKSLHQQVKEAFRESGAVRVGKAAFTRGRISERRVWSARTGWIRMVDALSMFAEGKLSEADFVKGGEA